jgi:hypothetical protein
MTFPRPAKQPAKVPGKVAERRAARVGEPAHGALHRPLRSKLTCQSRLPRIMSFRDFGTSPLRPSQRRRPGSWRALRGRDPPIVDGETARRIGGARGGGWSVTRSPLRVMPVSDAAVAANVGPVRWPELVRRGWSRGRELAVHTSRRVRPNLALRGSTTTTIFSRSKVLHGVEPDEVVPRYDVTKLAVRDCRRSYRPQSGSSVRSIATNPPMRTAVRSWVVPFAGVSRVRRFGATDTPAPATSGE